MPYYVVSMGTTGAAIARRVFAPLRRHLGRRPKSVNYLMVDAIAAPFDEHRRHFISIGTDGAGTMPHVGRAMFHQYYAEIKNAMLHHVDRIMRGNDPLLQPAKTAREVMGFVVVGTGLGGTSGGSLDPTISLIHDVAQQLNITCPRVHVMMISPEMILNDISRQPIPEQVEMVNATYHQNMHRILGLMQLDGNVCERRPDGSEFYVRARDRVFSLHKADRSNGRVDFSTTSDLVATIADTLHFYLFTAAGHFLDQRNCDIFGLTAGNETDRHESALNLSPVS